MLLCRKLGAVFFVALSFSVNFYEIFPLAISSAQSTDLTEGGLAVAILPKTVYMSNESQITVNVLVVNNQPSNDTIKMMLTTSGVPFEHQSDMEWFSWTSIEVFIRAKSSYTIPLNITVPSGIPDGTYIYQVITTSKTTPKFTAKDAGIIEVQPPLMISFTYPKDKSIVPGTSVLVLGHIDRGQPTSIMVNGVNASIIAEGDFWARLLIQPGVNNVVAFATDAIGHVVNASMTVVSVIDPDYLNLPLDMATDGLPPVPPILDPLESPVYFPIITVSGKVDWGTLVVTVDGGDNVVSSIVDVFAQQFEADVRLNPGRNTLIITVVDDEGLVSDPISTDVTYIPIVQFDPQPVESNSFRPSLWPPSTVVPLSWKAGVVFGDYLYSVVPSQWMSSWGISPPVLRIIDATQSWNFTVLSETLLNDTYGNPPATYIAVRRPIVEGNRLYISKDVSYPGAGYTRAAMEIYDISNPASPKALFKGLLALPIIGSWPVEMKVVNKILYVPHKDNAGLHIVNFTNPESPQILSSKSYGTYTMTHAVDVVGSFAYLSVYGRLLTINVTNPSNPVQLGSATFTPDSTEVYTHIQVEGNFAYFLGGPNVRSFRIFDVSDPAHPVQMTYMDHADLPTETIRFQSYPNYVNAGEKKGNTVYLTGLFERVIGPAGFTANPAVATVVTLDVTNPSSPIVTGYIAIPSTLDPAKVDIGVDISVTEDDASGYLTGVEGLYRITIRDDGMSFPDSTFIPLTRAELPSISMASTGDLLAVAEQESEVLDDSFTTNEYIDKIRIFDIDNPQAPIELSSIKPFQGIESYSADRQPARIEAIGDLVYIFNRLWYRGSNSGYYQGWYLTILNMSDPSNPSVISDTKLGTLGLNTARDPYHVYDVGVDIVDNVAYIPLAGGIALIDISNVSSPSVLSTFSNTALSKTGCDVKVFGNTAMLLTENRAVLINITNKTSPQEIGAWTYPETTFQLKKLQIDNNIAYLGMLQSYVDNYYVSRVTGSLNYIGVLNSTMWILNITDPSTPSLIATMDQPQFGDFQISEIPKGDLKVFLAILAPDQGSPQAGTDQSYFAIMNITSTWTFPIYKTFSNASLINPSANYYYKPDGSGILITEDESTAYVASGPPIIKTITLVHPKIKLSAITPMSGHPGEIVTITGRIFSPKPADNIVTFGNVTTTVLRADERSLDVMVPYTRSGNYTVSVAVRGIPAEGDLTFTLQPIFLNETIIGEITNSTFTSLSTLLAEMSIDLDPTDPMYQYLLDLKNSIDLLAQNVSHFDNQTKLFFDAQFASVDLQKEIDALIQQVRIMRGTEFSDYCNTAKILDISKKLQEVMDTVLKLIGALKWIVDAVGVVTGPGEIVIVAGTELTYAAIVDTVNLIWGAINTIIANEQPVFLKKITINPAEPIQLYFPGEADQPSSRPIQVESTWSNDPKTVGLPVADLIGPVGDLNDLLETLHLPHIPESPTTSLHPYEVNVALVAGEDFKLEGGAPVVEVNQPSTGSISAVEEGAGMVTLNVNLYGVSSTVLAPEVQSYFNGEQYVRPLSVRVKEPGPTIKILAPEDSIWIPGDEITVWVEASDGGKGGNLNLAKIQYKVQGAASANEERVFEPAIDQITTYFPAIQTPLKVTSQDDAWILITVTAYDTLGREMHAQKMITSPLGLIRFARPSSPDEVWYSLPASWPPGNFQMIFFIYQTTTAGTQVDMSTLKLSFGDSAVRLMDYNEFADYIDKVKQGVDLPDVAPRPGDWYFIPDRDLFHNGEPNVAIEPGDPTSGSGGMWMVTVTFDGPWEDAPDPPERAGVLTYFARYTISFKDNLGNYYEATGPRFFLNMKNCILNQL